MNSQTIDRQLWKTGFAAPHAAATCQRERKLEVNVIYTTEAATLAALKTAGDLGADLDARIKLIAAHPVPLAFPVSRPPVSVDFTLRRLKDLACRGAQGDLETSVKLYLCRDRRQALLQALAAGSLVVIGEKRSRWGSEITRIAKSLERIGHRVLFVPYR